MLLDAIDQLTGAKTDFADLPPGTRAIALPDNSYNRTLALPEGLRPARGGRASASASGSSRRAWRRACT